MPTGGSPAPVPSARALSERAKRAGTRTPLCGGEQLQTVRHYRPYLEKHALDTFLVDVCWQGFSAAKKAESSSPVSSPTAPRTHGAPGA